MVSFGLDGVADQLAVGRVSYADLSKYLMPRSNSKGEEVPVRDGESGEGTVRGGSLKASQAPARG